MGLVYHYTSPEAALSILQSRTLRFTDCEFLNDPAELAYCNSLYNRVWAEAQRDAGVPEGQIDHEITRYANPYECESVASDVTGRSVTARYYAFCTCRAGDDAALWANYATKGGMAGYALVFDCEALVSALSNVASRCGRKGMCVEVLSGEVCYDEASQVRRMRGLIDEYLATQRPIDADANDVVDWASRLESLRGDHWLRFSGLAPFFKRPEFSYEQEYRFTLKMAWAFEGLCQDSCATHPSENSCRGLPITLKFRTGFAGAMVPYLDVNLEDSFGNVLKSVRVFSNTESDLVVRGARRLMSELGLGGVSVELSNVRVRG